MLKDLERQQTLRDDWDTVAEAREFIARNLAGSFSGGAHFSMEFANVTYSLCLLFGYSVLEDALEALRNEGKFSSRARGLKGLMKDSKKDGLKWVDFDLVYEGKQQRDHIAHHRKWIGRGEVWCYLGAIEVELKSWSIL